MRRPPFGIRAGAPVDICDYLGTSRRAVAASAVVGTHRDGRKVFGYAHVWVVVPGVDGPIPWPAEDVRLSDLVEVGRHG